MESTSQKWLHIRRLLCTLSVCTVLTGCSLKDRSQFFAGPPPSTPTLTLNNESPRTADTLAASTTGSVDPEGLGPVEYRFEWFVDGGSDTVHEETIADGVQSVLPETLIKGQTWTVQVTPITLDNRNGFPVDEDVVVQNTPASMS